MSSAAKRAGTAVPDARYDRANPIRENAMLRLIGFVVLAVIVIGLLVIFGILDAIF